jgi:hypothetical protein
MAAQTDKVIIANTDYELGPETAHGRQVHYRGKQVGSIFYITSAETGEHVRFLALVQIYKTSSQFITRCLGEFLTLDGALADITATQKEPLRG